MSTHVHTKEIQGGETRYWQTLSRLCSTLFTPDSGDNCQLTRKPIRPICRGVTDLHGDSFVELMQSH